VEPLTEYFKKLKPLEEAEYDIRTPGRPEKYSTMDTEVFQRQFRITYNADLKTKACDILRGLLPAATLTNVGLFGNGRFYQGLLTRLYSSTLPECNRRAKEAHNELDKVIPKFVKRGKHDEYLVSREQKMKELTAQVLAGTPPEEETDCVLLPPAENAAALLDRTLAACLYPYSRHPLRQLITIVRQLSQDRRAEVLSAYTGERKNRRNRPGRALEQGYPLTFDIQGDFGAYRDLQRHRMLSQERQLLHPGLGFRLEEELDVIGMKAKAAECFDRSAELYEKMRRDLTTQIAQYAVLFGYRIRWMMGMNFREAMHLIELRTTPQGHPSYRKICQRMMDELRIQHPELAETIRFADYNEYYWSRAEAEARRRRKEREIESKHR
jgi:thymidylate synthase ThyX